MEKDEQKLIQDYLLTIFYSYQNFLTINTLNFFFLLKCYITPPVKNSQTISLCNPETLASAVNRHKII